MISIPMARCLARISGDGYLCKKYLRYNNTCRELIEEFKADIRYEFGNILLTQGVSNSGTPFVQVQRKFVLNAFLLHLTDFRSGSILVPQSVLTADNEVVSEYLRAFFDDEGCAAIRIFKKTHEWKRNITLTSNSYRFLEQVKTLLAERYGIYSNTIHRTNSSSIRDVSYVLSITGKKNILLFQQHIGFKHPRKMKLLHLMVASYRVTSKHHQFKMLELQLYQLQIERKGGQRS